MIKFQRGDRVNIILVMNLLRKYNMSLHIISDLNYFRLERRICIDGKEYAINAIVNPDESQLLEYHLIYYNVYFNKEEEKLRNEYNRI